MLLLATRRSGSDSGSFLGNKHQSSNLPNSDIKLRYKLRIQSGGKEREHKNSYRQLALTIGKCQRNKREKRSSLRAERETSRIKKQSYQCVSRSGKDGVNKIRKDWSKNKFLAVGREQYSQHGVETASPGWLLSRTRMQCLRGLYQKHEA